MNWRRSVVIALSVAGLLASAAGAARAQTPVPAPMVMTFSQGLRAQGFNLSDAEVAFLDADEQVQAAYVQALIALDLLSQVEAERRNDEWRQAVVTELQRILALDPAAAPAAPENLRRFRELAIAFRRDVHAAASKWLEALQANDPEWLQRGLADYSSARRRLADMQQELFSLYPPPQTTSQQP